MTHIGAGDLFSRTGQRLLVESATRAERARRSKPSPGSTRRPWGTAKQDLGGQLRSATLAYLRDLESQVAAVRAAIRAEGEHSDLADEAMELLVNARAAMDEAILLLGDWRDVGAG